MWNTALADPRTRAALAIVALLAGCSQPGAASQPAEERPSATPAAEPAAVTRTGAPASGVVSKTDFVKSGKPACNILFRYAGHEPETLFWKEPCKAVTTKMMGQAALESASKSDRLDPFDRKFVAALPGGSVLYVGGSFTASIYPIGSNGLTYDIPVAG